jgi:hypothetical protein
VLHQINISIHVLSGLIAIIMGIIAYASVKGGTTHRKYGRWFLGFIGTTIATAALGVLIFRDRPFLTVVTVQAAYMAYTGFRVLKLKERPFQWMDVLVLVGIILLVVNFFYKLQSANIVWNQRVIWYILSYLCLILAFDLLRVLWPSLIKYPKFWLYDHVFRMTGAFTALVSAGVGTVMCGWEPWSQIVPAILATWWVIFCLVWFPRRHKVISERNEDP